MEKKGGKNQPIPTGQLTKEELEKLKLQKEIEKIEADLKESKKPWAYKNLGILIPTVIGLATLLTGVFTGYFSQLSLKVENQVHDFTLKRDSLHHINDSLKQNNHSLFQNQQSLKDDKEQLKLDTGNLRTHINLLSGEQKKLQGSVTKLNDSLASVPFKQILVEFRSMAVLGDDFWENEPTRHLIYFVLNDHVRKTEDLLVLGKYSDTTKDLLIKGETEVLIFFLTRDNSWKTKLFETGDRICYEIRNNMLESYRFSYYRRFWNLFPGGYENAKAEGYSQLNNIGWKPVEIKEVLGHQLDYLNKIGNQDYADIVMGILDYILEKYPDQKYKLIQFIRKSSNFCDVINSCSHFFFDKEKGVFAYSYQDYFEFLLKTAPVAAVCAQSRMFTDTVFARYQRYPGTYGFQSYKEQMFAASKVVIEKNLSLLSLPGSNSFEGWEEWTQNNRQIVNLFKNISQNCTNDAIKKLIGND